MTPKSAAKRLRIERQQAIQRAMAIGLRARGLVPLGASDRFIPATAKEVAKAKT